MTFKGIPILRILDFEKAKEFYVEFLGFKIDWEHRFGQGEPVYMQISKNDLILHLSENKRFQTGIIIFVEAKGVEEFHFELLSKNTSHLVPDLSKTNWQTKQMELEDPFGNLLRFNEPL